MSKDNLSSLYNGLIKKGYSSDDIGDEATFRSKMADKENRKALYDYVSSRGDFRIGDYESYESRLSGKPEQEKPDIDVPAATAEQTAVPDETTVQDALPREQRKSLREQVGTGIPFAVPSESEMAAKFATVPTDDVNARLQKAAASGKLDTIINSEEEKNISQVFTPRPIVDVSDIYKNYSDRFSLTERGKELNAELADISKDIQGKYMQEFMASDEFKKLQNSLKGQELDDAANEAFRSMYSAKIDSELRPYVKAFQDEAFARYETDLSRDLSAYQEKEKQKTKESIASDVSSLSASVNNLLDDNHRRLSSHAGSGGSAMSAIMGSRKYIQETEQDRKSKSQLEAAQKLLEESQNIIDEAGRKGKTSFVAGLGRGFADTAFNADNWLFGLPDVRDSKVLMDTLDKYDKGEALTESEQALMDAAVANMATNAYYYSDLGRGYKAGSVTGQSIPFMLEFAINPVSGSGSAIAKSILKYGMKKFGKSAVKNSAAKFAARLAGDAAAAAAMTGTSSLARVAAGAIERAGGDIQLDETGTGYAGRTGQMGAGEALGKSFASTFLQNQSEMVLNAFGGLGSKIWKSAEKYIPGGTAAIMDNAIMGKAGEIYRKIKSDPTFKEVARRTQFHGISKEYLEELYNNFANVPLGEMTLEEATDLDNNIDTFLGLAPTSVAFGVIGLGGLASQKMQHRKKMKAAFGNMSRIERERLAKLEELGEKAGNEDIKNFIRETILDKDLSPEEKKAEIEYAYNLAVGNAIDDVEAAQQDEIQQSSLNASQEGAAIYAEHNPETMRQTVLRRELAEQKLIDAGFAAEDIERMKSTPLGERGQLLSSMDEASSQPVTDFFNAFDREEAMNEALDTAHEEEVSQARSMLQDIVLPNQTVTVIPLGQYGNEQAQYGVVVSGIDANGNPTQNNGAVVTYPVQVVNGVPDFSTIDKGNAVVAIPASYTDAMVFSPDDAFNGMLSAYQQDAAILEGTPISQGAQFPVMFDDGSMQNIIVAGTAPTGESVIVLPDGKTVNMPVEELSMRKRNAELAPLMAEQAEEEQVQQQAVQEAVTAGYSEEVKNLRPQVDERLVVNGENVIISEISPDGLIVNQLSESGDIIGSKMIPLEAYYDYKQTLFEQQNEPTQQQTTGENVSGQPGETGAPDSTVSTTEGEAAEVTGIQQEAGYPMDENGEPDFLRMQPQQTVQLLADTFAEDAASFVSDRLSAAQKAAEKAAKKSPKALGFNERVKELSEIKQERENAAREIEYWQNISSLIGTEVQPQQAAQPQQVAQAPTIMEEAEDESRKNQERLASMTEEEIAAAQAKVQENIDKGKYESRSAGRKRIRYSEQDSEMGEAFTPMEHVLREIATGRIVFQWSDKGSTQGLGSHLGMSDSNKERQSLIWALSNEGYTPEAAAEIIHGDMPAAMQELVTDQDVFNMILDAFSQYGSPSRMFEAAQQMHGNDLESQKGYEEDMERQQLEWEAYYNNMSVEDWSTLVDIIEEELEYQLRTFTDEDINAIFEEIYNEQYGTGRIETESTEGAQQSADSAGSNEIQPQQESDNETADGGSQIRPQETAPSDEQGGSTLSQPGFTVEKRYHKKDKKDIFAVNFTERMERAAFLDAKKKAKDAGGYYSSFGKGGFIFDTEEEARNFAESILPSPKQSSIEAARAEVEQNPTEAQKEAGNYKKGHITIDGYNITLENPKGSERSGTDKDGNKWSVTMNNDYGYIRGTEGVDGDHLDVFLSDTPESGKVFVVDQVNEDGSFDEHKVMYGFDTLEDAREAYLANYSSGWTGLGQITEVSKDQFKKWIGSSHRKTKPFAEYKSMITPKKPEEVNGYRKGDKVYYGGKPATIYDFEYDGRPVLDTGLAPVLYTIADWKDVTLDVSPITANFGKTLVNKSGETEIRIGKYDGDKQTVGVKINGEAQSMSVREVIGLLGSDEWSEVKEDKPAEKKSSGMQRVSVEGLFEDLKAKGTAKLSDNVVLSPIEQIKSNLDKEISKREKELDDIKSGKMPNTMYGNGSRRADLLRGEIREYKGKKQDIETLESLKPGVAYLGEGGKIITILSEKDGNYSYSVEIDGHSLELKATAEQMGNVVGMDDLRPDKLAPAKKEETAASQAPAYGSQNKVVSTARYEELRKKMREKLNNLNAGYDPEIIAIGAEMAAYHIEAGARTFVDFAKRMITDIGDDIRPYLKSLYSSARHFPGMEEYKKTMNSESELDEIDINSIKLEEDEQREPNPETVASEAEAVASEAESRIEEAETTEQIEAISEDIDDQIEAVNKQLSDLDYIDSLHAGMRVVLKDGRNVLLSVVMHHGEQVSATKFSKPHVSSLYASYKGELINFTPEDIDLDATIKYNTAKPSSELSGNSSEYQDKASQERKAVAQIGTIIRERALSSVDGLSVQPLSMKDVKKILDGYSELSDMSATDMQELVELAMTNETRNVALKYINSDKQKLGYDLIVSMYNMQPLLNARDSTRFERQQYSTPTPFGYVMGQFVQSGKAVNSVLEPSAGNGALTITFPSAIVHVNDIDERRLANLRTLGYGEVTNQDALLPFNDSVDVVMTNPPFGSTTTKELDNGRFKINSLEGLMAINALESMKDDGRAAIVIGGNTSYRENGAMQNKDMRLFMYLYTHYNVVDVINLDGDMYKRSGTKYNVRIILINGRKPDTTKIVAPPVKSKARAEQVKSFEELYNRIQDDIRGIQQVESVSSGTEGKLTSPDTTGGRENRNVSNTGNDGQRGRSVGDNKKLGSENNVGGREATSTAGNERQGAEDVEGLDNDNRPDAGSAPNVPESRQVTERSGSSESTDGRTAGPDTTDRGDNTGRSRLSVNLGDEKVPYPNRSQSATLMSVVPANQAQVLADSLANIGDVDQFLVNELGYSSKEELFNYLAAEQIDSVSLAINQMGKGNGFIIGDMTGVGKGRQGAALIRYAVRKGYKPIYFTQKPALFSDNYRDLSDIGSGGLRPFIIGSDPKNATITDAAGNVVHKLPSEKERKRVYDYIIKNGTLPDEYDYVITTYSQINNGTKEYEANANGITPKDKSYKKKSPSPADKSGQERRDVLEALAKDNIMILDESHTVGGSGGGSMFMQYIMQNIKGVTFLSATFAKRADNMPIYAMKTDLAKSGITQQELIDAIAQGGVTLQEIMSKQLVQSGQMIRRERSFNGVTIDWLSVSDEEDEIQRKQFDEVSAIFSDIRAFQKDYINPLVANRSEELADEGGYSDLQKGTVDLGATNTPFASKMYNLVNQLLFSLKADSVANRVIENLKNGFKPVISFTNTMEGFLDEAPKDTPMDIVPNFSLTLLKALDGVMRYTETDIQGEKVNLFYTPEDLGEAGKKKYYEIKDKIEHLTANLPISPMDAIKTKIEEAGYKVGEITGRNLEMVRNEEGKYIVRNRKDKDKKSAARDFNNGQIDVLMINKSGSTGISLHASPKFQDQRQRVMVFAQFQSDINDEVQMRGRIDRTGQIYRGKYEYIMSSIPAEQRLQMMFKAKLKSLDANTTSSQKSKFNEMQVTDFLNKYGDEVTYQYMVEHPELSEKLGDPLNLLVDTGAEIQVDETNKERMKDSASKIARYLPFLPVKEQEQVFKEIVDAYAVKIQLLNDAGENDLEITTMPLKAKTLSKKIWKPGAEPNSGNAFADNTYIEEVEVDILKKPMKADEVKKNAERLSEGQPFNEWRKSKIEEINQIYNSKIESLKDKLQKSMEEKVSKAKDSYIRKSKEARDKGKNEFTDEEIERLSEVLAGEIKNKANESFNKQKSAIEARRDNIQKILNAFEPLTPLVIPVNLEEGTASIDITRGMFLGFKFSKDYSPSSSTAMFATLDGRRKVEIPLKDTKAFSAIRISSLMQPTYLQSLNIDSWDSFVPAQTRRKAYIVTGNLLQALVDVKKSEKARGYLVSYSTEEGETRQGMLMSESFSPSDLTTSVPIRSRLEQIKRGETVVSEDKRVIIERPAGWRGGFTLKVPKSKKQGGEFFEDKTLRSLVSKNEFTSKGSYMVAEFDEPNLPKVLNRLSNLGVKVADKANLKEAKEDDTRFRVDETNISSDSIAGYEENMIRFRDVTDKEELDWLNKQKTVKAYRAMQVIDGKLYPPMMAAIKGKLVSPRELGTWEVADERPDIIKFTKKNKDGEEIGYVDLDKGTKDATGKRATITKDVAYNPYWHTSRSPLNDQFKSAWIRPNLVTVEVEIPESELTSGYRAKYSKNSVGETEWKAGSVSSKLAKIGKPRKVILSRWDKPIRIVPESEVASTIKDMLKGTDIEIPENVVTPKLKKELEKLNVKIGAPEKGVKKTEQIEEAIKAGLAVDNSIDVTRFRIDESEAEAMTYIIDSIHAEAAKLNIAVKVYTSLDQVPQGAARRAIERGLRVKGWHYKGDICVYLPYADGMDDIKATILHEGVAHFGLRKMVGEKNMNAFMDGIYAAASPELRKEIVKLLPRYNYDMHVAVEEYIATLVESGVIEPTFWEKVKQLFRTMLENLGFTVELTDNDLRYILWESRNNLLKSGNPVDVAKDTMMRKKLGIGMFGTRSPEETRFRTDKRAPLVEEYDAAIDNNAYRFQEAFQDSMLSLKVLQDLIEKQSGKPIRTFENAYTAENRLSSVNKVDNERYLEDFFKPLLSQIDKLAKMSDRNTVENYIYAKSGLERNEVFLLREADKVLKEKTEELDKRLADKLITQKQYDKELQELKDAREKFIAEGKDYSGLTGLVLKEYEDELNSIEDDALRAKRQKEIEKEYKNHAEKIVSDFEGTIPSAEVDKLWQLIKAANDENLRKQFDSGMISAERYEELRNMMQYYVPLRGWQESIAEDFYDYTRKESPVQKEKAAKGRKSLADNPIANIALSAQNAIILGNRNKMKQRFFNFIINRPNELVTIRDQWYARTLQTVHEQMEPVYPDIKETDDPDTIRQKLEDFESEMRQLEEAGLARRKKIPLGVELKMKSGQKPEHMVSVMINGQEYVMYINGNPRAAQALNGKTNPEGEENIFWEYYNKAKRLYGGGLTSNNPDFVAANFVRDSIHSATMQFLNNGLKSASLFVLNTPRAANTVFRGVMGKYKPGNVTDQYFQEFIQYGGETGYTAIHTIEDYKREYEKALNEAKGIKAVAGAGKKSIEAAVKALEVANRIAEDVNRFNAYMSSREAGKTIEESIDAAKNITVNFNKKGSLGKGKGAWAALAWFMNKWILFFNPAVQGLYQVGQTTKKNRKRVAGTLATIAASGFIMPYFNALLVSAFGGDDKDDYFYQTDYTRMNNWLIFTGDGYVKIPLPPFFREIYGMGDILHRMLTNRITPERAAVATMRQLQSAIGFINLIPEGEPSVKEAVSGIMPDIIAPLMDVALNRDFTGRDIAKDTEWTKNLPEYERVYRGVSPVYVEFSRMLNQIGGDDARRSPLFGTFINPAYMEHIITSYTGGIGRTISNITGAAVDAATGETDNIEFRTIPVINRFGSPVTERSIAASVNRVFYDYLDRYEAMKVAEKRYKAFIKEGRTDFRKELEQMKKNGESELIRYFDAKMKVLRKKQNLLKENPDNKDLEKQIIELKSEMVLKAKKILE